MKVFKFGGASIRDAAAIRNMTSIVKSIQDEELIIVVSAMGKTTNAIEGIFDTYYSGGNCQVLIDELRAYHASIISDLFKDSNHILKSLDLSISQLKEHLLNGGRNDRTYDQVVSLGEMISSTILFEFLKVAEISVEMIDAREAIITNDTYREGKVDWKTTENKISSLWNNRTSNSWITQGFIGGTLSGTTTTLGREGSDFTAAIFGSCLNAESVTIWKDVPGVMTADPKRIPGAVVFDELPYKEAAEMTYYGASVIHPKTIKPLAMKGIPLHVKSFDDPTLDGTRIHECELESLPPLVVFKENQCLVSCKVTDYSFVNEDQLSKIFTALSDLNIKINVMQNSAISFSFCIDFRENKLMALVERLKTSFEVYYNTGLTLVTVKNYNTETFEKYRNLESVLLEQFSRSTLQVLVRQYPLSH